MPKERKARKTYGVPETRGMLRTYRMCPDCKGTGTHPRIVWVDPSLRIFCPTCGGTGKRELLAEEYESVATRQAKAVVRETQGHGKIGRSM